MNALFMTARFFSEISSYHERMHFDRNYPYEVPHLIVGMIRRHFDK
jgi:hypothetical protein